MFSKRSVEIVTTTKDWTGIRLWNVPYADIRKTQRAVRTMIAILSFSIPAPLISIFRSLALSLITSARGQVGSEILDIACPIFGGALYVLFATAIAGLLTYPFIFRPRLNAVPIVYMWNEPTNIEVTRPIFLPWPIFKVYYIELGVYTAQLSFELRLPADFNRVRGKVLLRYRVLPGLKWAYEIHGRHTGIRAELQTLLNDRFANWQIPTEAVLNFVEACERPDLIRKAAAELDTGDLGIEITRVLMPQLLDPIGALKERNEDERQVAATIRKQQDEMERVMRMRASEQAERLGPPQKRSVETTVATAKFLALVKEKSDVV
jgi:hypothetical protein